MQKDKPHSQDLRKGRFSATNQIYVVTSVTLNRQPIFTDMRMGRILVNVMRDHAERGNVESLAFVVMPDHFHWLFTLCGEYSLSKLIGQVKGASAYQIGQIIASVGAASAAINQSPLKGAPTVSNDCGCGLSRDKRIWQKGFHDHALRCDEDVRAVARYLVMNPVRAGIVSKIWDYPLWDAVWVDDSRFDPA